MSSARSRLLETLRQRGDAPAITVGTRRWSYAELDASMRAWAQAFRDQGVGPGDRVAVLAVPSAAVIGAMLGAYAVGAIWVPINTRYRAGEIGHILRDAAPRLLLCEPEFRDVIPTRETPVRPLEDPAPAAGAIETRSDDAAAMLIYTSGTTGRSKGATLSYAAVVGGIEALTGMWGWTDADVLSLQLPLFHVHGLCIGVHGSLLAGMHMRLHEKFSAAAVVKDVRDHGATVFMGVPTMYTRLLAHLEESPDDGVALRRARLFTAGSAALPAADLRAFEALTGHRILERYGMSETLITLSNPLDGERRPGCVGREVPGVAIRIVGDDGAPVATGQAGELYVQTPAMMSGYWNNTGATDESFDGPWFRTGDVVTQDQDGYVRIVGRKSVDIIKSGGFKISAREIEEALLTHPNVAEAAVIGVPDATWGERIEAAVVLAHSMPAAADVLVRHAASLLADYKKPRAVHVVDALPRNALGKLQKVVLKQRLAES